MKQKTICRRVSFSGFSAMGDSLSVVTLRPAPEDSGIFFFINGVPIPATMKFVDKRFTKWTSLTSGGETIHLVEHSLSAFYGLGITNVEVVIDEGNSIPILDGSAAGIVDVIQMAGIDPQEKEQPVISVGPNIVSEYAIDFKTGKKVGRESLLISFPYPKLRIIYSLDYQGTPLRHQLADIEVRPVSYQGLVAPARTFMTTWEIDRWRGSLLGNKFCDMVPRLSTDKMFAERMRGEAAAHKVLDMIGDLALLGMPVRGLFIGIRSGHSLNKEMVKCCM
jgi:UDP-3-O-acyl-N-acetylglucosamine deacetylase